MSIVAPSPQTLATVTTLVAEVAMALHPILIKQLGTNLPTQLLSRLGIYSILGLAFASSSERKETWGTTAAAGSSIALGIMNLIHIASSYLSYELLPAGTALALFYTYPFMNILAGVVFLGDSLDYKVVPLMIMAFIGVVLISKYTKDGNGKEKKEGQEQEQGQKEEPFSNSGYDGTSITYGVVAALVAAFTETLIFLVAKTSTVGSSPFLPISRLYPGAFLGILAWIFFKSEPISTDVSGVWIPMILFNVVIGFLGYSLRFFSIPRLPTAIFSILTFIGVAAGYGWGLAYAKEVPSAGALAGAGLITGSLGILRFIR